MKISTWNRCLATFVYAFVLKPSAWSGEILTVCEALSKLASIEGRDISVRGEWRMGEHGQALMAPDTKCPNKLKTGPYVWTNGISLVEDSGVQIDFASLSRIMLKLEELHFDPEKQSVVVSVTGTIESGLPKEPFPQSGPFGFGHLNSFPARLRYQSMSDLTIKPRGPNKRAGDVKKCGSLPGRNSGT
jgi:hypothetical protein